MRACMRAPFRSVPYHSRRSARKDRFPPFCGCVARVPFRFADETFSYEKVINRGRRRVSELRIMTRPRRKVIDSGIPRRERRWKIPLFLPPWYPRCFRINAKIFTRQQRSTRTPDRWKDGFALHWDIMLIAFYGQNERGRARDITQGNHSRGSRSSILPLLHLNATFLFPSV